METMTLFDIPTPGLFTASCLAEVVSVEDEENLSRVQVRLLNYDGIGQQDGPIWARLAVPFAGRSRGAFFVPDVGDEVLVTFLNGDSRLPVVIGGLWNGSAAPPEQLGGDGTRVDRWTIVGKAGTRIAIIEENEGEATISLTTPGGVSAEFSDAGGGQINFSAAGTTVTIDSSGVTIDTGADIQLLAGQTKISSGQVKVEAAMSTFSGLAKADVLQAPSVAGNTYAIGAGNIW